MLLWIRRFAIVYAVAFVVIAGSQLLRGRAADQAVLHGLLWSTVSASIFVAAQWVTARRQQRCAVCELVDGKPSAGAKP